MPHLQAVGGAAPAAAHGYLNDPKPPEPVVAPRERSDPDGVAITRIRVKLAEQLTDPTVAWTSRRRG